MSFNTNAASFPQVERLSGGAPEVSDEKRFAQRSLLSEMPGLVFGLITIVYIVTALWSLA